MHKFAPVTEGSDCNTILVSGYDIHYEISWPYETQQEQIRFPDNFNSVFCFIIGTSTEEPPGL
jgi:hypothetical protein